MLSDKLGHQSEAIQQRLRLDFSAVVLDIKTALVEQCGQVTNKLQAVQQQLQELELGSMPARQGAVAGGMDIKEVLAAIRQVARSGGAVDLTEVLEAIKAVPGLVDLSYEFSAVLTAIQDKQSEVDLQTLQSVVGDCKQDLMLQLEDVRSLIRSQACSGKRLA